MTQISIRQFEIIAVDKMNFVIVVVTDSGTVKNKMVRTMTDVSKDEAELLTYVAGEIGIKEAKAFSVATFYENFSFEPKGKYVIKVCDGTACHVKKSHSILHALYEKLKLSDEKRTTDDLLFTIETVSCLGACGLAPVMLVNDSVHGQMTPDKTDEIIDQILAEEKAAAANL